MSLNERISKVIEYSALTPSEFADAIDVQRSSISHITSGRNKPSLEFIIKIKSRFPELLWNWLITGEGEMVKTTYADSSTLKEEIIAEQEKIKTTSLPDLFTMMSNDEIENTEITNSESSTGESFVPHHNAAQSKIADSQRLEKPTEQIINQITDNQQDEIKRIVIFFKNGKFESFEP